MQPPSIESRLDKITDDLDFLNPKGVDTTGRSTVPLSSEEASTKKVTGLFEQMRIGIHTFKNNIILLCKWVFRKFDMQSIPAVKLEIIRDELKNYSDVLAKQIEPGEKDSPQRQSAKTFLQSKIDHIDGLLTSLKQPELPDKDFKAIAERVDIYFKQINASSVDKKLLTDRFNEWKQQNQNIESKQTRVTPEQIAIHKTWEEKFKMFNAFEKEFEKFKRDSIKLQILTLNDKLVKFGYKQIALTDITTLFKKLNKHFDDLPLIQEMNTLKTTVLELYKKQDFEQLEALANNISYFEEKCQKMLVDKFVQISIITEFEEWSKSIEESSEDTAISQIISAQEQVNKEASQNEKVNLGKQEELSDSQISMFNEQLFLESANINKNQEDLKKAERKEADNIAAKHSFKRVVIPEDGNCLFATAATWEKSKQEDVSKWPDKIFDTNAKSYANDLFTYMDNNMDDFAVSMRGKWSDIFLDAYDFKNKEQMIKGLENLKYPTEVIQKTVELVLLSKSRNVSKKDIFADNQKFIEDKSDEGAFKTYTRAMRDRAKSTGYGSELEMEAIAQKENVSIILHFVNGDEILFPYYSERKENTLNVMYYDRTRHYDLFLPK